MGTTPLEVRLSADQTYVVEFLKEGYDPITRVVSSKVGAGWVILDLFGGLIPLVVDAATGNWKRLDHSYVSAALVPNQAYGINQEKIDRMRQDVRGIDEENALLQKQIDEVHEMLMALANERDEIDDEILRLEVGVENGSNYRIHLMRSRSAPSFEGLNRFGPVQTKRNPNSDVVLYYLGDFTYTKAREVLEEVIALGYTDASISIQQ